MTMIALPLTMLLAIVLDRCLGEPGRWHPLVGLGHAIERIKKAVYGDSRQRGLLALLLVLILPLALAVAITSLLADSPWLIVIDGIALYLAIGGRSLREHALDVAAALEADDLSLARRRVALIVSRDCRQLDRPATVAATVESVLENGNDAILAPLFWFAVAGLPGVVGYRIVNTLDAMWGYRTPEYRSFGWASARLDDLMNYLPARLTALCYALCGRFRRAIDCWQRQATAWESPNAGPVMAAGAGSLGIQLGGPARYHGENRQRPPLGHGRAPEASDIQRSLTLLEQTTWLFLVILISGGLFADGLR